MTAFASSGDTDRGYTDLINEIRELRRRRVAADDHHRADDGHHDGVDGGAYQACGEGLSDMLASVAWYVVLHRRTISEMQRELLSRFPTQPEPD